MKRFNMGQDAIAELVPENGRCCGDTLNVGDFDFGTLYYMSPIGPRQVQLALKISFQGGARR
jgi:hypothetical protein